MKTLREGAVADAMAALGGAQEVSEIGVGLAALTASAGLQRYVVVDVRGGLVTGLHHNAPRGLRRSIGADDDPIASRARTTRIPFEWHSGMGGPWRDLHGDHGYRSGVAGSSWDPSGSGCVLMLSCREAAIRPDHGPALLGYALMAAVAVGSALKRLVPAPRPECPFTSRELDCLLYAVAGRSSKETARALGIEARTVHQYLERARARLGVSSSYAAATTALRHGWLDMQRASELAGLGAAAGTRQVG